MSPSSSEISEPQLGHRGFGPDEQVFSSSLHRFTKAVNPSESLSSTRPIAGSCCCARSLFEISPFSVVEKHLRRSSCFLLFLKPLELEFAIKDTCMFRIYTARYTLVRVETCATRRENRSHTQASQPRLALLVLDAKVAGLGSPVQAFLAADHCL